MRHLVPVLVLSTGCLTLAPVTSDKPATGDTDAAPDDTPRDGENDDTAIDWGDTGGDTGDPFADLTGFVPEAMYLAAEFGIDTSGAVASPGHPDGARPLMGIITLVQGSTACYLEYRVPASAFGYASGGGPSGLASWLSSEGQWFGFRVDPGAYTPIETSDDGLGDCGFDPSGPWGNDPHAYFLGHGMTFAVGPDLSTAITDNWPQVYPDIPLVKVAGGHAAMPDDIFPVDLRVNTDLAWTVAGVDNAMTVRIDNQGYYNLIDRSSLWQTDRLRKGWYRMSSMSGYTLR